MTVPQQPPWQGSSYQQGTSIENPPPSTLPTLGTGELEICCLVSLNLSSLEVTVGCVGNQVLIVERLMYNVCTGREDNELMQGDNARDWLDGLWEGKHCPFP